MLFHAKRFFLVYFAAIAFTCIPLSAMAKVVTLPDGSKLDLSARCPLCNMEAGASASGPAALVFNDGKVVGLAGTAHLLDYLLEPGKYGFDTKNVKDIYVTDFGTKKFVDAKKAYFVLGSDLKGMMGPAVVAFSKKERAEAFKAEHKGKGVVTFSKIHLNDVKSKRKMMKMPHM
jgi:nitrous oxide reductase accessory protein NosL